MVKKYIIDLNPDCVEGEYLRIPARIAGKEQWLVTKAALTPYTEPDIEKVREEAYRQGYDTGYGTKVNEFYEQGLVDAWEAARKIANMPYGEEEKVFGSGGWKFIINHTASEAIEKLKTYEQERETIQVGDEVRNIKNGWIAVVSNIDGECMTLMDTNGALGDGYDVNRFTKTGRHFPEIAAVLEKMRGGQDG